MEFLEWGKKKRHANNAPLKSHPDIDFDIFSINFLPLFCDQNFLGFQFKQSIEGVDRWKKTKCWLVRIIFHFISYFLFLLSCKSNFQLKKSIWIIFIYEWVVFCIHRRKKPKPLYIWLICFVSTHSQIQASHKNTHMSNGYVSYAEAQIKIKPVNGWKPAIKRIRRQLCPN